MYVKDSLFKAPPPDAQIWRYMNFTKFISLLDNKSLYFTRADQFNDPYEGVLSKFAFDSMEERYPGVGKLMTEGLIENLKLIREYTFINCWHLNEFQSAAMWDLYCNNEGVAIQTTFENLCNSLKGSKEKVNIGKVEYKDYNSELVNERNFLGPFICKRKSFEHEKELRAIHLNRDFINGKNMVGSFVSNNEKGILVTVDLNILVQKIYIAPTAPTWFKPIVKSVAEKYNLNKPIEQSDLYDGPVY